MSLSTIEIALDKQKLNRTFIVLVCFVIIGALGAYYSFGVYETSEFLGRAGGATSLFTFSLSLGLLIMYIPGFRKKGPGLIISKEGVTELASLECVGFIPWTDIIEFKLIKEFNQRLIAVVVRNQNDYLKKKKGMKQRIMLKNNKLYGSVIAIPLTRLKIIAEELKPLLDQKLGENRLK
jgi:hypothetical protein